MVAPLDARGNVALVEASKLLADLVIELLQLATIADRLANRRKNESKGASADRSRAPAALGVLVANVITVMILGSDVVSDLPILPFMARLMLENRAANDEANKCNNDQNAD